MKCFFESSEYISVSIRQPFYKVINNMFAFLRSGNFTSARSGLPGLYTDNSGLKYDLLCYTVMMRENIATGHPLFKSVCGPEFAIESPEQAAAAAADSTEIPKESSLDFAKKNAAFAEMFAKELTFLNRTIQMISLIARRYHEEQEDLKWGNSDIEAGDELGGSISHDDDNFDDDAAPSALLCRSESSPSDSRKVESSSQNQLADSLLIGSGQLMRSFNTLCARVGLEFHLVNSMTTADKPLSSETLAAQRSAGNLCVSKLYSYFCEFPDTNRGEVVECFQDLCGISQAAWGIMSWIAFTNLYRLTKGTDFELAPLNPDDAILANRGRPFVSRTGNPACYNTIDARFFNRSMGSPSKQHLAHSDASTIFSTCL